MRVSGRSFEPDRGRDVVEVRLFGRLTARREGRELDLGPPKQRALFAVLVLHGGQVVSTDRLIDLLWGARPPRTAAHSLQVYVSELRRVLGPSAIRTERPGYVLESTAVTVDIEEFEGAAARGRAALRNSAPEAADALQAAVELWHAEPLAEFEDSEFAEPTATRLRALRLDTLDDLAWAWLSAGAPARALPIAERSVREEPLRESSRELLMLALYRCGRFPEALRTFVRYRRLLADELGLDPSPRLQGLYERILVHEPSLDPSESSVASIAGQPRNPYKGLRPFGEHDAEDFFGRDALVERVVERLRDGCRMVAVVGPSGCGKSSVLTAGLLPRLRAGALPGSDKWTIVRPAFGSDPAAALRAVIATAVSDRTPGSGAEHSGTQVLLILDQFEENFIAADDNAQHQLLDALCSVLGDEQNRAVLTLRADLYDRPLRHPEFAELFTAGLVNVLPMRAAELQAAIVTPARQVGVSVEDDLVAELVAEAGARPALLPLLQYALTELFEGVAEDGLRLARYREIGGLSGALTRRAEHMRQSWTQTEQEVAIQLFLRLVRVGHDGRAARRRLPVQELAGLTELDSVAIAAVVEDLAHHRLISVDRDIPSGPATIEVAHECLFEQWPWLRDVVSTHLAVLRSHDSLQTALAEWEAADRDPDYLLSGGRLEGLMTASRGGALQFTDAEIAFLDACQASAAVAAAKARARSRRQRVRLSIAVATAAGAAAAAAAVLAAPGHSAPPRVAFVQGGDGYIDDLVAQGIDRASRDNRLTLQIEQAGGTNPTAAISQLAQHGENLVLVSADGVDVQDVAAHYPRTRFVDLTGFGSGAHMTDVAFADQQGAFLAGAAATLASKSKRVGFLGGVDIPVIRRFEAGFIAGVHAVDPSAHVLVRFAGRTPESGFRDPALDGMVAREMLRAGVDVLFPAAGQAQFGAVQAVVEYSKKLHRKLWAIGVDEDIYRRTDWERGPNDNTYVLTSMIKRYDVAAYQTVRDFIAGTLQSGTRTYDLRNGGMTLAASGGYLAPFQSRLNALRRAIVAGSIVVPCVPPGLTGRAALDASAGPKCP